MPQLDRIVVASVVLALAGCSSTPHSDATDAGTTEATATTTGTDDPTTSGTSTTDDDTTFNTVTTDDPTASVPDAPEFYCPGSPSGECDDVVGARLQAGAAVVSIVPDCFETWTDKNEDSKYVKQQDEFYDCGCDRICPEDGEYPGPDAGEGDGEFQAIWMAGFGTGRATAGKRKGTQGWLGVDDGLWARAAVLRQGETTVAIVALDLVGFFNEDVIKIRELIADAGLDVDYLLVHSTHNHEGPDTMGLWGSALFVSGYQESYTQQVREAVVSAIEQSINELREVDHMELGAVDVSSYGDGEKGVANVIRDSRDPVVIDETLSAARFVDGGGNTIATLVNFGSHPETLADDNLYLTSDYVHGLRRVVEKGSMWMDAEGKPGVGGVCVYLNGAVGGMMTTLGVEATTPGGEMTFQSASFEKADVIGQLLGEMALDAISEGDSHEDLKLRVQAQSFLATVENSVLMDAATYGVIKRTPYKDPNTGKEDKLKSEMALITVGPLSMLSVPGELLPELAIGGYDGSHVNSDRYDFIDPNNPFPPEVTNAPEGPYLKERMPGEHRWIIGLGNDEVGYIVPEYDFVLAEDGPYLNEHEGDHYEETNSLGPKTAAMIDTWADFLIAWSDYVIGEAE
ncbi:MAG: hypothetical protein R3A51_08250 [Nannocystaceae bacterium]|nr:hypothetical protein [Myxococcales bacterium]